ncbi:hypothetical protein OVY01_20455 [Robbsia sp. Bb-Pol-6]|uniref:Uncharacterized protein n=1 Tax=Robbsia betulipollinis TaxID=2981849 RepID=A0ABT3ZSH2_9BURK|nr:hypothetical protein [Robbsia betulipollinis]MCY0389521.1 hypothetical protein [Robbsia betulipollinis]
MTMRDRSNPARARRLARVAKGIVIALAIGAVPPLSALAGSISVPILRDTATGAVSKITSPVTDQTNKIIAPAADLTPRIGDTTAAVNDTAMFRADSALQNQIASDSSGWISK